MRPFAVALALLLSLLGPVLAGDEVPDAAREWSWSEERASLATCVKEELGKERAHLFDDGLLAILNDGKKVLELRLHRATSLARSDRTLLVAEHSPIASGAAVAAWDLASGKLLWRTQLEGVGAVAHSEYSNAVTLEVIGKVVSVRGNESAGRYVECLEVATGTRLHHAKLPALEVPEAAKEWRSDAGLASLERSAKGALASPFSFTLERTERSITLAVSRPMRPALRLEGLHDETPLARREEVLVVAELSPIATGCELVAHDLVSKKLLWRRSLLGLGPVWHSKYRNRVNLAIVGGFVVARGEESSGRYVEVLEVETGVRVWHARVR